MSFHSEQTAIHRIHTIEYADAAERLAATGFDAIDIGKVSRQLDNDTFFILISTTPTWVEITDAAGNMRTVDNLVAGQLLVGDGGLDVVTEPELLWSGTGLGIGITPSGRLHIYEDTSFGGPSGGVTIEQDGTGDAMLHFLLTGGQTWITGIDNSGDDKFKIEPNNTFNNQLGLAITTAGDFGLGISNPIAKLHVSKNIDDTEPLVVFGTQLGNFHDFYGVQDPEGAVTAITTGDFYRRQSVEFEGGSGLFIFKNDIAGDTGWEEVLTVGSMGGGVTTSDDLLATQFLLGNGGNNIITEPDLIYDGVTLSVLGAGGIESTGPITINPDGPTLTLSASNIDMEEGFFSMNENEVISLVAGDIKLSNIDIIDAITQATILAISGNVHTPDDLIADQLLLGNGDSEIVTVPSITYTGGEFRIANDITDSNIRLVGNVLSSNETVVLTTTPNPLLHAQIGSGVSILDILATSDDNVSAAEYRFGRNSLSTGANRILLFEPDSTTIQTRLATSGQDSVINAQGGSLGLGIGAPISLFHLYENSEAVDATAGLTIEQDGLGDTLLHFVLSGTQRWVIGLDNSASDMLKFQSGDTLDVGAQLVLDTNGKTGIGEAVPPDRCLHVQASIDDTEPLLKYQTTGANGAAVEMFFGLNDPEGLVTANPGDHYSRASGVDSGLFIFAGAAPGDTGWEEAVTAAGVFADDRILLGNGTTKIATDTKLTYNGTSLIVGDEANQIADGRANGIVIENAAGDSGLTIFSNSADRGHIFFGTIASVHAGEIVYRHTVGGEMNFSVGSASNVLSLEGTAGMVGINQVNPAVQLHITTAQDDTGAVTRTTTAGANGATVDEFIGTRNPEGLVTGNPGDHYHRVNGIDSNDFIQKAASSGNTGWRESVTTPDAQLISGNASGFTLNQLKLSLDDELLFTHAIKTRHHATNQFDNAIDFYLWDADEDADLDVGTMPVLTLLGDSRVGIMRTDPTAVLDIFSNFGDTTPIIKMESSSNAGTARLRVGNRNPNGTVNGESPDLYFHDAGTLSGVFENRGSGSTNAWLKHSALSPTVIEIHNSDELDALASGGVITVASDLTLRIMGIVTTANRFVIDPGVFFIISGEYIADSILLYTGTDTFITSSGNTQIRANASIVALSTGTLLNCTANSITNIEQSQIAGWDDLGIVNDARAFFLTLVTFQNISAGLTFNNVTFLNINATIQVNDGIGEPFFRINTNNPESASTINDMDSRNSTVGASLLDIDTRVHPLSTVTVTNSVVAFGDLFKQSVLTDATIDSVADGSPATGTITAMADNGSGGTTISCTTTYFEDELVTISGTTSYNNNGELLRIFNVVAGVSFDIITEFVADDATGSVDSTRLTLSLATGHGISTGDSIKIIDTNFYNSFETTLNVVSDDITVNGVFVSTNTGSIERDLSLDHSDPRVSVRNNPGFADSHDIACAHVNNNVTANGAITNTVFTDMVFGTAGTALIASSTMERWKLVDELNGTFEFIGNEIFDGTVTFDFTVVSSGGTVDFRFKWMIDKGAGFVDLTDDVEALVAVGSASQSVTKTYPLAAVIGDRIKPQITRNSGASTITATYVTMYVSQ